MTRSELDPEKLRRIEAYLAEHQSKRAQIVGVRNTKEEKEEMRKLWNDALDKMRGVCSCFCESSCFEKDD